jgi:hypothetical protein
VKGRSIVSILLSLLLAQAPVLPGIDRRALDLQARAEALQTARNVSPPRTVRAGQTDAKPESRRIRTAAATPPRPAQPQRQPVLRSLFRGKSGRARHQPGHTRALRRDTAARRMS